MIILPGVLSNRGARRHPLALAWSARDASLVARSGQTAQLTTFFQNDVVLSLVPAYGGTVLSGRTLPRFGREGSENVLDLTGNTEDAWVEVLAFPWPMTLTSYTALLRLKGMWTAGSAQLYGNVFLLGDGLDYPWLACWRGGASAPQNTGWSVQHLNDATPPTAATLAEPSNLVWPLDVLVIYDHGLGKMSVTLRDANGTVTGPATTSGTYVLTPGTNYRGFSGDVMTIMGAATSGGGPTARLYHVKVALAVKTFAQMDALPL